MGNYVKIQMDQTLQRQNRARQNEFFKKTNYVLFIRDTL